MNYTPMMEQYREVKRQHPQDLLMFRLGDFYELFFDDAELAARELEITLTSREAGSGNRVPMCGVPYHAVEGYIARLIAKGYRVAICEQVEDPKLAKGMSNGKSCGSSRRERFFMNRHYLSEAIIFSCCSPSRKRN